MLAKPSPIVDNSSEKAVIIHQRKIIKIINSHLIRTSRFGSDTSKHGS